GQTLAEAAQECGAALLGANTLRRTGARFPLLIKILDCQQWLSVQVHPNDEQAWQMEGPDQFGKTEAWYVLDAAKDAQLIAGVRAGTSPAALAQAIRNGTIVDLAQYHQAQTGDTVFMPAGTLHALGPGFLIYEVQQTSNLTYRIFDWNRPASAGRALHIEQSVAVTNAQGIGQILPAGDLSGAARRQLVQCPYFTLTLLAAHAQPLMLDTHGQSFHAITIIEGQGTIACGAERVTLNRFETVLVAAQAGEYQLHPIGPVRALQASVE
ncbi:MAG TPA: type I phosphomannose isomerase catalytic subunit, partial [Anaerolineae bacterium]|nr:type I phosphomannose isomerase catalytic subunit [Anaerolineae bacterium]